MKINEQLCVNCGICVSVCPFGAAINESGRTWINDNCTECGTCADRCPTGAIKRTITNSNLDRVNIEDYHGFWVVGLERGASHTDKITLELLSTARRLADNVQSDVSLVCFGDEIDDEYRREAQKVGCNRILQLKVRNACIPQYRVKPLLELVRDRKPEVILFPATSDGRDLAPKIACGMKTGLTADCTDLSMSEKGNLVQIRPTYGGNILATIETPNHRPQMASVRPNVMQIIPYGQTRECHVEAIDMETGYEENAIQLLTSEVRKSAFQSLDEANIIFAGGYGLGSKENFQKLIKLAGKMNCAVAATRKAVDLGWADSEIQVGQTGKTVSPNLYIAFGISGALQHTLGIQNAKQVIAVNNDPAAPILQMCDVPILGDAVEVLGKLMEIVKT